MSTEPLPPAPAPVPGTPAAEDRTVAILSYITPIGFIVAIVLHSSNKTKLGAFHLRQVLGLIIASVAVWIGAMITFFILAFIPILGPILITLIGFGLFIVGLLIVILGLIAAFNGQMKPVPVIGPAIQKHLANTFT
jgi:uncharacterized membrane protein